MIKIVSYYRCALIILPFVAGIFLCPELPAREIDGLSLVNSHWAVHESSGRAFATVAGNEVVETSADGEVRRFKVGDDPTELMIKRNLLIVACTKAPALHVIDLARNEVLGKITMNGKGPYALFCSQMDDGLAYAICNPGDAWWDGEVFQVDLKTMKIRKQARVQRWGQSHPKNVAMSRDGRWIVPDARGASSPSGADLMKVDGENLVFQQIRDYHDSFGKKVAGPMNRYWTFGNKLYSLDISKTDRTFQGEVCAIHPGYDLVASFGKGLVYLESLSDSAEIGRAEISIPAVEVRRSSHKYPDATVKFDLKNNLVFVGTDQGCDWVDLGDFKDDLKPLRMIKAPSEQSVVVNEQVRIPVSMTNAGGNPPAKLTIEEGPENALLADGFITWTPTAEQIGVNTFDLAIKSDGTDVDTSSMTVSVTLPKADVGFRIKTMKLSPNGKKLMVWGPAKGDVRRHSSDSGTDSLALIDTATRKVEVSKTISQGIRDAALDDNHVYLAAASGNVIYKLDHGMKTGKRQFLPSAPRSVFMGGPDKLVLSGDQSTVYNTKTMTAEKAVQTDPRYTTRGPSISLLGQTYAKENGRIVNRRSGELQRYDSTGLPLAAIARSNQSGFHSSRDSGPGIWARRIANGTLTTAKGSRIAQISNVQQGLISEDWPVGIMVAKMSQGRNVKRVLQLCDLVDGTIKQSATLKEGPNTHSSSSFYGARTLMISREKNLYIVDGTEVMFASLPQAILDDLPMPVHFSRKQPTEIQTGAAASVELAVGCERKGLTFSLLSEYEGLELDETSGRLSFDTKRLWELYIARALKDSNSMFMRMSIPAPPSGFSTRREVKSPFDWETNSNQYKKATGKELAKENFAVALPISVGVRDEEGQTDNLRFQIVMTGPKAPLDQAMEKARATYDASVAEARKRQAEQKLQREKQMQNAAAAAGGDDRLDALEARMRRMEAALDSILQKLEK